MSLEDAHKLISVEEFVESNSYILSKSSTQKLKQARLQLESIDKAQGLTQGQVRDLVLDDRSIIDYRNGEYQDSIRLFLFCRRDRSYPCRFLMKDQFGEFVKDGDRLWSLPALAKSKRGFRFNKTNGNTPTGIHTIDSVMPMANRELVFGKFRRMILNWIPKENGYDETMELMPSSHRSLKWWQEASIARDIGRKYLRIHGTGRVNDNSSLNYYPHMPTAGCISTKEGRYGGVNYRDQRRILDKIMETMHLGPVYQNEIHIKGVLFVLNLDDRKSAVSIDDLNFLTPFL